MTRKKRYRPECKIEYIGVKGLFTALLTICKVGLIKIYVECKYIFTAQTHGIEGGKVRRYYYYAIPKYRIKKVTKFSESEVH